MNSLNLPESIVSEESIKSTKTPPPDQNSQQEHDDKIGGYTQESVQVKGGHIVNSLLKLRQKSEVVTALVLGALVDRDQGTYK